MFFIINSVFSQHIPAGSDRYTPTNNVLTNPASIADPIPYSDFKFLGLSVQAENNLFYAPKSNFRTDLSKNIGENRKYAAALNAEIQLPAFVISKGTRSFGFNIRQRNMVYAKKIPYDLGVFIANGLNYPPQHYEEFDGKNYYLKGMSWGEIGFNYAQLMYREGNVLISGGVTAKILTGLVQTSMLNSNIKYSVDSQNVYVSNLTSKIGFSEPGSKLDLGLGADIGIEFKKMLTDDNSLYIPHSPLRKCAVKEYKYMLGLSILDLGAINFKNNTTHYTFSEDSLLWLDHGSSDISSFNKINNLISSSASNANSQPVVKNKYLGWLPLSLNLQADYNFENNLFLYSSLELGMHQRFSMGAERISRLSVVPRYEVERITAAIPLTMSYIQPISAGFYLRVFFFSVGTNNLLPIIFKRDLYSADIYFSFNWKVVHSTECEKYFKSRKKYCPKPNRKLFKKKKKSAPRELKLQWK